VGRLNLRRLDKIGDGARNLEHPIHGSGGEAQFFNGAFWELTTGIKAGHFRQVPKAIDFDPRQNSGLLGIFCWDNDTSL
jgi:hypothetical protein